MKEEIYFSDEKAQKFAERIREKNPLFICVIGNTETAKIPGISAAGANPEITDFTPPADVELLFYGRCRCIDGVPITPDGIPTPALITMSALELAEIPKRTVVGGLNVYPKAPYVELGGLPGRSIQTGNAVDKVEEVLENAKTFGKSISSTVDYLVIGESIAGGTTTALGVMTAMGIDAGGKVSSSMSSNPHDLKMRVVEEGMENAGITPGELKNDPIRAVSCLGDPMIPAFAGLVIGAAEEIPVLLAGGTQMGGVLSMVRAMNPDVLKNTAIGTTRWIISDEQADLQGIVKQIGDIPIIAANLDFSKSEHDGLRAYEREVVKEGVGAGGITIAAMLKCEEITIKDIVDKVEENYGKLTDF